VRVRPAAPGTSARGLLGPAVLAALAAGALAVVAAAVVAGGPGAAGASIGLALVVGFLLLGQVPVAQVARGRRGLAAGLLLMLYTARVGLLLIALRVLSDADGVDREAVGLTVIAAALAWTAGTVWSALRWRPLVVEPAGPEEPTGHEADGAARQR
jgi:ATP synthase protein I